MASITITRGLPLDGRPFRVGDEYDADEDGVRRRGIIRDIRPVDGRRVRLTLELSSSQGPERF
jgi:hypothetical protein